jgi:hypothetical protein
LTTEAILAVMAVPAGWLLWQYMKSRMENLAREASERVLQDERHTHEQQLATLNASLQKRLQEFGLYSKQQHRIYPLLYAKVREAADRYGRLAGVFPVGDFSKFMVKDVVRYAEQHRILEAEIKPILDMCAGGPAQRASDAMADLDYRVQVRDAGDAFQEAKNIAALKALYLSDDVRSQLSLFSLAMGRLSAEVQDPEPGRLVKTHGFSVEVDQTVVELHRIMRDELRRGGELEVGQNSAVGLIAGDRGHDSPSVLDS